MIDVYKMAPSLFDPVKISAMPPPPSTAEKRLQQPHIVRCHLFLLCGLRYNSCLPDDIPFVRFGENLPNVVSPPLGRKSAPAVARGTLTLIPLASFLS